MIFTCQNFIKIGILVFLCFIGVGSYFCYDSPVALEVPFLELFEDDYNAFNSLYYWCNYPNVIFAPINGLLVDTVFGIRNAGIIFTFFVALGQFITAYGTSINQLWIMDLGRVVFAVGGDTLVTNNYCVAWYKGSILNLSMGIVLSVSRFGSVVGLNALSTIYNKLADNNEAREEPLDQQNVLGRTMGLAGFFTVFSFVSALCLALVDKLYRHKVLPDNEPKELKNETDEKVDKKSFTENVKSFFKRCRFGLGTWLVFLMCVFYYSTVFPLISQGTDFFIKRYNTTEDTAVTLNSMPYLISLPAVPIFGILIDSIRHNVAWVGLSILLTSAAFLIMLVTSITPWIPVILIGLGYALLACALWPLVSYLVPESNLGFAYGVMMAIENLGLALTMQISGWVLNAAQEAYDGYQNLIYLLLGFQAACAVCCLFLWKLHGVNCEPNGVVKTDQKEASKSSSSKEL